MGGLTMMPAPVLENVGFFLNPLYMTESTDIILLSDLHFSRQYNRFNLTQGLRGPLTFLDILTKSISTSMAGKSKTSNKIPAAIVCTGDITHSGDIIEYQEAQTFFSGLLAKLGLTNKNLLIVPGNHDIRWGVQTNGYDDNEAVTNPSNQAEDNYRN
ncbi:MAG: metallophosphoesterase, partial [Bacteroidales bacterium]|nr:metallophosphoesterase [Bacteroidales bacterium]